MKSVLAKPIEKQAADSTAIRKSDDDSNWAIRSAMWRNRLEKATARRTKRAKAYPALILPGMGCR